MKKSISERALLARINRQLRPGEQRARRDRRTGLLHAEVALSKPITEPSSLLDLAATLGVLRDGEKVRPVKPRCAKPAPVWACEVFDSVLIGGV